MPNAVTVTLKVVQDNPQAISQFTNEIKQAGQAAQQQQSAFSGLASSVTGMITAYAGMKGIQAVAEMVQLGEGANKAENAFRALTSGIGDYNTLMTRLRTVTLGVADDMTLQQGASRLLSMGIATNADELSRLSEMAVKLGGAMGKDAANAMQDFALLLANNSVRRLDNFGISVDAVKQKMDELKKQGMETGEAFKMATLEVGQQTMERLGSAAEAAATPLDRLITRVQNFGQDFAQNVATAVNGILGIIEIEGQIAAQGRQPGAAGYQQAVQAIGANFPGGANAGGIGDGGYSALTGGVMNADRVSAMTAQYIIALINKTNLNPAAIPTTSGGFLSGLGSNAFAGFSMPFGGGTGGSGYAAAVIQAQLGSLYGATPGGQGGAVGGLNVPPAWLPSLVGGGVAGNALSNNFAQMQLADFMSKGAGVGKFGTQETADSLEKAFQHLKELSQQGLISDEDLRKAQGIADNAQKAADAYKNMTLSQALGQTNGGFAAQVDDSIIAAMRKAGKSDAEIAAFQQQRDLASGRQTRASIAEQGAAQAIAGMSQQDAIKATNTLTTFLQRAAQANLSDADIAKGISMITGVGQAGQQFTVKAGDTASGIAGRTGMTVDQILAAAGVSNARLLQPGTYGMAGGGFSGMTADMIMQVLMNPYAGPQAFMAGQHLNAGGAGFGTGAMGIGGTSSLGGTTKAGQTGFSVAKQEAEGLQTAMTAISAATSAMSGNMTTSASQMRTVREAIENIPSVKNLTIKLNVEDPSGAMALIGVTLGGTSLGKVTVNNNGNVPGTTPGGQPQPGFGTGAGRSIP